MQVQSMYFQALMELSKKIEDNFKESNYVDPSNPRTIEMPDYYWKTIESFIKNLEVSIPDGSI